MPSRPDGTTNSLKKRGRKRGRIRRVKKLSLTTSGCISNSCHNPHDLDFRRLTCADRSVMLPLFTRHPVKYEVPSATLATVASDPRRLSPSPATGHHRVPADRKSDAERETRQVAHVCLQVTIHILAIKRKIERRAPLPYEPGFPFGCGWPRSRLFPHVNLPCTAQLQDPQVSSPYATSGIIEIVSHVCPGITHDIPPGASRGMSKMTV
jgi:hypothetical protein